MDLESASQASEISLLAVHDDDVVSLVIRSQKNNSELTIIVYRMENERLVRQLQYKIVSSFTFRCIDLKITLTSDIAPSNERHVNINSSVPQGGQGHSCNTGGGQKSNLLPPLQRNKSFISCGGLQHYQNEHCQ